MGKRDRYGRDVTAAACSAAQVPASMKVVPFAVTTAAPPVNSSTRIFEQVHAQGLGRAARDHAEPALVEKRQVGAGHGDQQQEPDGDRRAHANSDATAFAHSVISPPGTMPSSSTRAPLTDSTERTSMPAVMPAVWVGASKYMTLTRRR